MTGQTVWILTAMGDFKGVFSTAEKGKAWVETECGYDPSLWRHYPEDRTWMLTDPREYDPALVWEVGAREVDG